jgi:hypothetical protein
MRYWKQRARAGGPCGPAFAYAYTAGCDSTTFAHGVEFAWRASARRGDPVFGSDGFGVRRPVRFLAERLDLDERQTAQLGRIVERIRIEREQAAVDLRRAAGELADALEGSSFEEASVEGAGRRRIDAATSVQKAVTRSLRELHEMLDAEQREELAALIRSGALHL